jgi:hypothetical protein
MSLIKSRLDISPVFATAENRAFQKVRFYFSTNKFPVLQISAVNDQIYYIAAPMVITGTTFRMIMKPEFRSA